MSPTPPPVPAPVERLLQLATGRWASQALCAAVELGIPDLLGSGPRSAAEIAREVGAVEDAVYRLLRALSLFGVVEERPDRSFALLEAGHLARRDVPGSFAGFIRYLGHESNQRPWMALPEAVRTGNPTTTTTLGAPFFDYLTQNPDSARIFDEAMTAVSLADSATITAAWDFSGIGTLADVGGGHGLLLATILEVNPSMKGILLEMPHVLEGARELLARHGVLDRVELVGGSFFDEISARADACILKHIVHDWDDERSVTILRRCRAVLPDDGLLLLAESVVPPPNVPGFVKLLDLEMLVLTGNGRERDEEEYAKILSEAGFRLVRVIETGGPTGLVEARPA